MFALRTRLNPGGIGNVENMSLFINLQAVKKWFVQLGVTMLSGLVIF